MRTSWRLTEFAKSCDSSKRDDAIVQPIVEDPIYDDRIPVVAGAEPIPTPCEPSEFEKMKHELTHIPSKPRSTSCVKGKAQAEPHKRIERTIEDSELPINKRDYLVLKDTAASDGLKVLNMYAKPFGCGTSTGAETKGALRHHLAIRSRCITHQLGRKCEIQSEVLPDDHIGATDQWKNIKKTLTKTSAHDLGSASRPHTI